MLYPNVLRDFVIRILDRRRACPCGRNASAGEVFENVVDCPDLRAGVLEKLRELMNSGGAGFFWPPEACRRVLRHVGRRSGGGEDGAVVGNDAGDEVAAGAVVERQERGGGVGGEDPGESVDVVVGGADGVGPPACRDVVPGFVFGEPEVLSDRG